MDVIKKRIACIRSTRLGYEDHGILTYNLELDYGSQGGVQGAGNVVLRDEHTDRHIRGVLAACGVSYWEALKGRTVYAYADWGKVYGLEPLPTEPGKRFAIMDEFDGWIS